MMLRIEAKYKDPRRRGEFRYWNYYGPLGDTPVWELDNWSKADPDLKFRVKKEKGVNNV